MGAKKKKGEEDDKPTPHRPSDSDFSPKETEQLNKAGEGERWTTLCLNKVRASEASAANQHQGWIKRGASRSIRIMENP